MRRVLSFLLILLVPVLAARVAVPRFLAPADDRELANLAKVMPAALASALVGAGEEVELLPYTPGVEDLPLLFAQGFDEVLLGKVLRLGSSVAVEVRRYQKAPAEPGYKLAGSAAATASNSVGALELARRLLADLYAEREGLNQTKLAHLLVVPGNLKLPLGGHRRLKVLAMDASGREIERVSLVFQVEDPAVARVDELGNVQAVSPGETKVQVQAVGIAGAGEVKGEATVTVVPPAFGLRLGGVAAGERPPFPGWLRVGLRLSSASGAPPGYGTSSEADVAKASENPLDYLASFFASIVTGGQLTAALDYDLGSALLFHLEAYQRNSRGYFGAGLGFATPTGEGLQGVSLRLVLGSYLLGTSYPLEAVGEAVFPTASDQPPTLRLVLSVGLDLYP